MGNGGSIGWYWVIAHHRSALGMSLPFFMAKYSIERCRGSHCTPLPPLPPNVLWVSFRLLMAAQHSHTLPSLWQVVTHVFVLGNLAPGVMYMTLVVVSHVWV